MAFGVTRRKGKTWDGGISFLFSCDMHLHGLHLGVFMGEDSSLSLLLLSLCTADSSYFFFFSSSVVQIAMEGWMVP